MVWRAYEEVKVVLRWFVVFRASRGKGGCRLLRDIKVVHCVES